MTNKTITFSIESASAKDTLEAGKILGQGLMGGEVIAIDGELGSGKTTFIRGLGLGLEIPDNEISSPTFVFVHEHRGRLPLAHVDLYRIGKSGDIQDLGVLEYFETSWVVALEWADKSSAFLPDGTLFIQFTEEELNHHRKITFHTSNGDHKDLILDLKKRLCTIKS